MCGKNYERIQKYLARIGCGSRRQIERLIKEDRITVDDKPAVLGDKVRQDQTIKIDGILVEKSILQTKVIIYNKPVGEICSNNDPHHTSTVFQNLPDIGSNGRWVMVGRLDINSQGLIIFTNNGDYAHKLMHPNFKISRVYKVRVSGKLSTQQMRDLTSGVQLDDGKAKLDSIRLVKELSTNSWYKVIISSGKNRIIRRLMASQNVSVSKLIRISYGPYSLPYSLKTGKCKFVEEKKI